MTQETGISEDGFVIPKIMYYLILLIIILVIALGIFTKVFIHGLARSLLTHIITIQKA
jgi:hypothetical protein